MNRRLLIPVLACATLATGLPTEGHAQTTRSSLEYPLARPGESGFMVLVPARDRETMDAELDLARELRNMATTRLDVARAAQEHSETQLKATQAEIKHLENQAKLAESENRMDAKKQFEDSKKRQEQMFQLFQKHRELRKKDTEAAQRLRVLADAKIRLYEDEYELRDLRRERDKALTSESPNRKMKDLQKRIQKLEKQLLEGYLKQLEAEEQFVQKQKESFEKRLDVFKAQEKAIQEGL